MLLCVTSERESFQFQTNPKLLESLPHLLFLLTTPIRGSHASDFNNCRFMAAILEYIHFLHCSTQPLFAELRNQATWIKPQCNGSISQQRALLNRALWAGAESRLQGHCISSVPLTKGKDAHLKSSEPMCYKTNTPSSAWGWHTPVCVLKCVCWDEAVSIS